MRKASGALIVILLLAVSAAGQEAKPDYSRDALTKFFAETETRPKPERNLQFHAGGIEFRALGTKWRIAYLPILMPLQGSRPTVTNEWPDAFSLTGTQIATSRRAWRTQRAVDAELRRINRRIKAKVKVTPE